LDARQVLDEKIGSEIPGIQMTAVLHEDVVLQLSQYWFEYNRTGVFANTTPSLHSANSSWANFGYLVASEIDPDDSLRQELRRLNESFGIGVMIFNHQKTNSSKVLFEARKRDFIDWQTTDVLVEINNDFKRFFQHVEDTLTLGRRAGT